MAYRYITTARINSTIKKHNLRVVYTKGSGYFTFVDLTTGDQVGENVMIARMHHYTIQQWREAAAQAAATRGGTSSEAEQVRELVATLDEAETEEVVEAENCPF